MADEVMTSWSTEDHQFLLDYKNMSEEEFILKYFVRNMFQCPDNTEYNTLMEEHVINVLGLLGVLAEREAKYLGLWRLDGWDGCLALARHKFLRVMRRWWKSDLKEGDAVRQSDQDDIYDLINYLMFTATLQREGRKDGTGF